MPLHRVSMMVLATNTPVNRVNHTHFFADMGYMAGTNETGDGVMNERYGEGTNGGG